jgi:hypothetical protein
MSAATRLLSFVGTGPNGITHTIFSEIQALRVKGFTRRQ